MNETLRAMSLEDFPELFSAYQTQIINLKDEIKKLEQAIKVIFKNNPQLWASFQLITTVKGIGFIIASYLIAYTYNFKRFDNCRKFACYSGIAPFDYQSGTSIRGKHKLVHLLTNKSKKCYI